MATRVDKKANNSSDKVTVYVRNYAKKAIMLTVQKNYNFQLLKQRISQKMKIAKQNQILFLNGQRISDETQQIQLQNKNIFHLVNIGRLQKQKISVTCRTIEPESQSFRYTVSSSMLIRDFIQNMLAYNFEEVSQFLLVYTGRELKQHKTFRNQLVEDQSQIICLHKIKNAKSKRVKNEKSKNRQSKKINTISQNPEIKQQENSKQQQGKKILRNGIQEKREQISENKEQVIPIENPQAIKNKEQASVKQLNTQKQLQGQKQSEKENAIQNLQNTNKIQEKQQQLEKPQKQEGTTITLYDVMFGKMPIQQKAKQQDKNAIQNEEQPKQKPKIKTSLSSEFVHIMNVRKKSPLKEQKGEEDVKKVKTSRSDEFRNIMNARKIPFVKQIDSSTKQQQENSSEQIFVKKIKTQKSNQFIHFMNKRTVRVQLPQEYEQIQQTLEVIIPKQKTQKSKEFHCIMSQRIQKPSLKVSNSNPQQQQSQEEIQGRNNIAEKVQILEASQQSQPVIQFLKSTTHQLRIQNVFNPHYQQDSENQSEKIGENLAKIKTEIEGLDLPVRNDEDDNVIQEQVLRSGSLLYMNNEDCLNSNLLEQILENYQNNNLQL